MHDSYSTQKPSNTNLIFKKQHAFEKWQNWSFCKGKIVKTDLPCGWISRIKNNTKNDPKHKNVLREKYLIFKKWHHFALQLFLRKTAQKHT